MHVRPARGGTSRGSPLSGGAETDYPGNTLLSPWNDTQNPDCFDLKPHPETVTHVPGTPAVTLLGYLTRGHYDQALRRTAQGKASGPDGIPNEVLTHLPREVHDLIYSLSQKTQIMAENHYTPTAWCRSATCLIYKPNKKDPHNPACYRPIALMNGMLKLWTSVLTKIGSAHAESLGIINDDQDGFRALRQMYDSLTTHVMMLEDAKLYSKNIYTAFADFKGAFNGTDHRLMFQFMRELGIPECYVATCEQLYLASNTYYMTPHGNTADIPIRRGTLQGDTLSPFLFTLFPEPLMRWLKVGSRGYQPACSTTSTGDGEMHVTYDEHGYADDISITTGTLHDMQIQLHKLHLFSKYTGLQLEISKCEVTGALWHHGNPASKSNLQTLRQQIETIELGEGTHLKFLPLNRSYKMLGVHVNAMLDFRDHYEHITKDVRKIAAVLQHNKLSPGRKQRVVEQLLKSKYHAVHLGILTDTQLDRVDRILNTSTCKAYNLIASFPTEAIPKPLSELGLGKFPIQERATQMGLEHLVNTLNKPSQRGHMAFAHVSQLAARFQHWPAESDVGGLANLPTVRLLRYIHTIPGMELLHIPKLQNTNEIATTLRFASKAIDNSRAKNLDSQRHH